MATITCPAWSSRPFSMRTVHGSPSLTSTARVCSKISPPSPLTAWARPTRYLHGWNSACSSKRTAPATSQGRSVSSDERRGQAEAGCGLRLLAHLVDLVLDSVKVKLGRLRKSQSMASSRANRAMVARPASFASP